MKRASDEKSVSAGTLLCAVLWRIVKGIYYVIFNRVSRMINCFSRPLSVDREFVLQVGIIKRQKVVLLLNTGLRK